MAVILVTGAAGFIGFHTSLRLLERGDIVIGIDEMNDYYDPKLKEARRDILSKNKNFIFYKADIADRRAVEAIAATHPEIDSIIHLAAQAGVRYSLTNPYAYTHANVEGQLVMLELARSLRSCRHMVYASSSSVYGSNKKLPFSEKDRVDNPISLYAATKKAAELMSHCYSHLYQIPTTGLRFFTVYGPWGRPDMALFLFTKAILEGKPVRLFNNGDMRRDFTYIDDIVTGVIAAHDAPPCAGSETPPYRIYNIGNHRSEDLRHFIEVLEQALGKKAIIEMQPMQPGDVRETYADIEDISHDLGFTPQTTIETGIPRFVEWYRSFYGQ